jgi:hypothetical protein
VDWEVEEVGKGESELGSQAEDRTEEEPVAIEWLGKIKTHLRKSGSNF